MKSFWTKISISRYLSTLVILFIFVPTVFIVAFGHQNGSYVGMFLYLLIGIVAIYEVLSHLQLSFFSKWYLSLLIVISFLLPYNGFKELINHQHWLKGVNDLQTYITRAFNWENIIFILIAMLLPLATDRNFYRQDRREVIVQSGIIFVILIIVPIFVKMVWVINIFNYTWVFFFIAIAPIGDTFAYFGGKYLGKYIFNNKKLLPHISPKKTYAGLIVGWILTALYIGIVGYYCKIFHSFQNPLLVLIIATILLSSISPAGDLFFSAIKRNLQIKDFSNLIPGHGGILDRLDANAFVFFAIFLIFLFS